jgi:molybdenum cofactor cytidylyltransferase
MPLLQPDSLRAVARALAGHPVAYAQHQGRQGFPVGFSGELRLSGDEGVRRLLARYPSAAVEVDDPGVLFDVNTVDDLDRARRSVAIADLQ